MCNQASGSKGGESGGSSNEAVQDFTTAGFGGGAKSLAAAHAQLPDVQALKLQACVGASYDRNTNQICFTVPIYGPVCVTSPISIPVTAELKACVETCGSIIPTGVKATIYLNGSAIWSGTVFGFC